MERSTTNMEKIMATVGMSQILKNEISESYHKQLEVAYRKEHNVQPAIDIVRNAFEENSTFKQAVELQKEWLKIQPLLAATYDIDLLSYRSAIFSENVIEPCTMLGIVCNPNRPIDQHLTKISGWNDAYKDEGWDDVVKDKPASDNFVEGDVAIHLNNLEPFYMPYNTLVEYTKWRAIGYAPNANNALLITDPVLCDMLIPVGQIESKILIDLQTFKTYLDGYTTLKKFTDEFPSGSTFVPQEYLDKMHKKVVKKTTTPVAPEQIIPDELKAQMKEVILENKLLGN